MALDLDEERDYSPEALREREKAHQMDDDGTAPLSTGEQAALDQIEAGLNDETNAGAQDQGSPDNTKNQSLEDRLGNTLRKNLEDDGHDDTGFYTGKGGKGSGTLKRRFARFRSPRALIGLGGGAVGVILGGVLIFNFLNVFKLESLLNNIDVKSFSRFNASFDRRSDAWLRSYIRLRLMEYEGTTSPDRDNLYFKANRVDTDHPIRDWYRTLRTGSFEKKIFNDTGIEFVSMVGPDGRPKPGRITFKGTVRDIEFDFDPIQEIGGGDFDRTAELFTRIDSGDLDALNTLDQRFIGTFVDEEVFGSDREARRAIKTAVNDNTFFFQVLRRRHVRKDIQNRIGVRDWRFFDKTRTRVDDKKIELQKKLLQKIIPESTKSGKFILCVFGAGPCPSNTDANNPANRSSGAPNGSGTDSDGDRTQYGDDGTIQNDADGNPVRGPTGEGGNTGDLVSSAVDEAASGAGGDGLQKSLRATLLRKILSKAVPVIGVIQTADMLSRVDANITSGKLTELAELAKGDQAVAAYTTFAIARDQARSGELISDEYNLLMGSLEGAEVSEAGSLFLGDNPSTASAMVSKETYCDDRYIPEPGEYVWNCDKYRVGAAGKAGGIQEAYQNSIGEILSPAMEAYRAVRDGPIIGRVFDLINAVTDRLSGIIATIVDPILGALGISDKLEQVMAWFTERVMVFLGAGPILAGLESEPGLTYTMIAQGGAVSAENSMRGSGAGISNRATKILGEQLAQTYEAERLSSLSIKERYFDPRNPNSLITQMAFTLSSAKLSNLFTIGARSIGNIFTGRTSAQNTQSAASFAGIETYDFPMACIDRDPLAGESPSEYTNADTLTNEKGETFITPEDVTFSMLGDADSFWSKVYSRVDPESDTDNITVNQIYNCETLEKRVRGGLGNTSGYKDDGGLEDGGSAGSSTANGPVTLVGDLAFPLAVTKSQIKSAGDFKNGDTNTAGHPYIAYDILAGKGTTVVSMTNGKVVRVAKDCGGETMAITVNIPEQGISIWYGHLDPSSVVVVEGQGIKAGTPMGQLVDWNKDCKSGADHLHIDATVNKDGNVFRPGCARDSNGGCSAENKSLFRSIGPQLFTLFEALPE